MSFSEKQLVDLFLKQSSLLDYCPWRRRAEPSDFIGNKGPRLKRIRKAPLFYKSEYSLPNGRRVDLLFFSKTRRLFWLLEFKVEANVDALVQVCEYKQELYYDNIGRIHGIATAIVAQYFHPHTIFLAEQIGVQCIQVAPVNNKTANYFHLVEPDLAKIAHGPWVYHV